MRTLLNLYRIKLFSITGIYYFVTAFIQHGKSIFTLLAYCSKKFPHRKAINWEHEHISYSEFYLKSLQIAKNLVEFHGLENGKNAALIGYNNPSIVFTLFALARSGANVYVLNPEMSCEQLDELNKQNEFDLIIYQDEALFSKLKGRNYINSLCLDRNDSNSIRVFDEISHAKLIKKRQSGNIISLTGGTQGKFKSASRSQSILNFINPLNAIIGQVKIYKFKRIYVPTPIYHGFGLASLLISVLQGSEIYLTSGFDADESRKLIEKNKIEVVTLVPTMLVKLLKTDTDALNSLKVILSGGASLSPGLISRTNDILNSDLFNLYGTTEAGFCILGTPADLREFPNSLGKPIKGVKIRTQQNSGTLEVKSNWTSVPKNDLWINTDDLVEINAQNFVFLKGRSDDMISSGGENVYPIDLENVLSTHNKIELAAVKGMIDEEFGERLKAVIVLKQHEQMNKEELVSWLKPKIARYQMPAIIEFTSEIPTTSIGKVNWNLH